MPVGITLPATVTQILAVRSGTCALREREGDVRCWGYQPVLGRAVLPPDCMGECSVAPVSVLAPSGVRFTELFGSPGTDLIFARSGDGRLWCWGDNAYGTCVSGGARTIREPAEVRSAPPDVEDVAVGEGHVCLLARGTVWCWGSNSTGQLGRSPLSSTLDPTPRVVVFP
jgi:hypothetical protein